MSEENHGEGETEGVKTLRAALEKANNEIAELRGVKRTSDLDSAFRAKNVDSKYRELYPADAELTEDAVGKWAEKFGFATPAETPTPTNPPAGIPPAVDPNALAALQVAQASSGTPNPITAFNGAVADPAALQQLLKTADYATLVRMKLMPDVDNGKYQAGTAG